MSTDPAVLDHSLATLAAMSGMRIAADAIDAAHKSGQLDGLKPEFRCSHKVYSIPGPDSTARSSTGVTITLAIKFSRPIETPSAAAISQASEAFISSMHEAIAESGVPPLKPLKVSRSDSAPAPMEDTAVNPPGGAALSAYTV
jgi:hypothetical protein